MNFLSKVFLINIIISFLFFLDRLLKFYFLNNPDISWGYFFGLIHFSLEKNLGIAYGIRLNYYFLLILIILIIFILSFYLIKAYQKKKIFLIFALTLILVGAVSNLVDRIYFGYVIDYLTLPFFTIFNLADCLITGGVILLLVKFLIEKKKLT